jgi:hypothetical protein
MRSLRWCVALAALLGAAAARAQTTPATQAGEREPMRDNSFFIEEAYNQEAGVAQHIFNWVGLWNHDDGRDREFVFTYTLELPIFSQDHQFSLVLPTLDRFEQGDDDPMPTIDAGGFGDMLVNYRYQLVYEDDVHPAVAPRAALILPTGDFDHRLGAGTVGYNFNLPISKEVDPFAFHLNAGYTYVPDLTVPLDSGLESPGRDVHIYSFGLSVIWLATLDVNLLLELFAFIEDGIDDVGAPERTTNVLINPGVRYALYTDDRVQWVVGAALPVGLSRDAPDIGVFGYMSIEHVLDLMH